MDLSKFPSHNFNLRILKNFCEDLLRLKYIRERSGFDVRSSKILKKIFFRTLIRKKVRTCQVLGCKILLNFIKKIKQDLI